MARKLKIMENEKNPLDLKNDEITKKREKWDAHSHLLDGTQGPQ